MSKVKVSQKVYDAFKVTEGPVWYFEDKEKYLKYMFEYKAAKKFSAVTKALNEISNETFLKALNDGYELELTPHEKVLEDYKKLKEAQVEVYDLELKTILSSCIQVMEATLNNLEIYIEGVNK